MQSKNHLINANYIKESLKKGANYVKKLQKKCNFFLILTITRNKHFFFFPKNAQILSRDCKKHSLLEMSNAC